MAGYTDVVTTQAFSDFKDQFLAVAREHKLPEPANEAIEREYNQYMVLFGMNMRHAAPSFYVFYDHLSGTIACELNS